MTPDKKLWQFSNLSLCIADALRAESPYHRVVREEWISDENVYNI
jgi:hypothetical protein